MLSKVCRWHRYLSKRTKYLVIYLQTSPDFVLYTHSSLCFSLKGKQHTRPTSHANKIPRTNLHTILLTLLAVLGLLVALEGVVGDVVEAEDSLHGVLHDQILAILHKSVI